MRDRSLKGQNLFQCSALLEVVSGTEQKYFIASPAVSFLQQGLVLSPAEPLLQKLVEKIRSGQFVEMKELLADNIAPVNQLEAVHGLPQMHWDRLAVVPFPSPMDGSKLSGQALVDGLQVRSIKPLWVHRSSLCAIMKNFKLWIKP